MNNTQDDAMASKKQQGFKSPNLSFKGFLESQRNIIEGSKIGYRYVKEQVLKRKKASIIVAVVVLALIVMSIVAKAHRTAAPTSLKHSAVHQKQASATATTPHQKAHAVAAGNSVGEQLNDISIKLANIEQKLSSGKGDINISDIKTSLASLGAQVSQLADHSNQLISQEIKQSASKTQSQLGAIKKELTSMNASKTQRHKVSAADLPFAVVSIDNIQQSEIVTVNYAHHTIPLEVGQSLAGWRLMSANSANQKAEFSNKKDYAPVNLNQLNVQGQEK